MSFVPGVFKFHFIVPCTCLAQFSLNNVHKKGLKNNINILGSSIIFVLTNFIFLCVGGGGGRGGGRGWLAAKKISLIMKRKNKQELSLHQSVPYIRVLLCLIHVRCFYYSDDPSELADDSPGTLADGETADVQAGKMTYRIKRTGTTYYCKYVTCIH